jgi:hypothetical protein
MLCPAEESCHWPPEIGKAASIVSNAKLAVCGGVAKMKTKAKIFWDLCPSLGKEAGNVGKERKKKKKKRKKRRTLLL